MMIVRTDNFCRDTVDEKIIEKDLSEDEAILRCKALNDKEGPDSPDFYEVKPDNYVPYTSEV